MINDSLLSEKDINKCITVTARCFLKNININLNNDMIDNQNSIETNDTKNKQSQDNDTYDISSINTNNNHTNTNKNICKNTKIQSTTNKNTHISNNNKTINTNKIFVGDYHNVLLAARWDEKLKLKVQTPIKNCGGKALTKTQAKCYLYVLDKNTTINTVSQNLYIKSQEVKFCLIFFFFFLVISLKKY